ncbi:hypothetical protein [Arthrobacter alpinus]|nr:hypothetical protein [Arthrobacter alpinus]
MQDSFSISLWLASTASGGCAETEAGAALGCVAVNGAEPWLWRR